MDRKHPCPWPHCKGHVRFDTDALPGAYMNFCDAEVGHAVRMRVTNAGSSLEKPLRKASPPPAPIV